MLPDLLECFYLLVPLFLDLYVFLHCLFEHCGPQRVHPFLDASTMALVLALNECLEEHTLGCLEPLTKLTSPVLHAIDLAVGALHATLDSTYVVACSFIDVCMVNIS